MLTPPPSMLLSPPKFLIFGTDLAYWKIKQQSHANLGEPAPQVAAESIQKGA